MAQPTQHINPDFELILKLIHDSRNRVYAKANAELVMLYFSVGGIVSQKVAAGNWGDGTVDELANFIHEKQPQLSGFNRRGLYRMKQFYETYNNASETFLLWQNTKNLNSSPAETQIVTTPLTQLQSTDIEANTFVTPLATQFQSIDNEFNIKVSAVPTKIDADQITKVVALPTQLQVGEIEPNLIVTAPLTQLQSIDIVVNTFVSAVPTQNTEIKIEKVSALRTQIQSVDLEVNTFVTPLATQIQYPSKPLSEIVSPLATQLLDTENQYINFLNAILAKITWTNHLEILSGTKTAEEKLFYLLITAKDNSSKAELRRQISTATYERTMLSNKIATNLKQNLPDNLFKDPYIFEFLELPENHSEKDLEHALIQNLQKFILEIGKGFSYMGNQFRLQVGNKDYYTDLLFYHRDLQCLVLFELKIEEFQPEHLGKLNFYLEALDRDVKRPHENPSIGVLLCKGKDTEVVEYATARYTSTAMVADYETKLIDKTLLANKLHQLVELFENREIDNG